MTEAKCTPGRFTRNLLPWALGVVVIPLCRKVIAKWKPCLLVLLFLLGSYCSSKCLIWLDQLPPHDDLHWIPGLFLDIANGVVPFMLICFLALCLILGVPALARRAYRGLRALAESICNYDPKGSN